MSYIGEKPAVASGLCQSQTRYKIGYCNIYFGNVPQFEGVDDGELKVWTLEVCGTKRMT